MVVLFHLLLFLLISNISAQSCVSKPRGKKPSKPCIFPFRYKGKTYDSCTTDDDKDNEFWCAIEVKANGDLQTGEWGYCEDECLNIRNTSPISVNDKPIQTALTPIVKPKSTCMTKSRGNNPSKPCKFPFKLSNGNVHDSCTTDQDTDGKLWCSTKVDSKGDHVRGHWGYCGENCQTDIKPVDNSTVSVNDKPIQTASIPIVVSKEEGKTWRETFPVTYDDTDGRFLYSEDDGCGKSLDEGQIVGGEEAKIGELPFMALLGYRSRRKIVYQCGGTLINRRYVISAAHCHKPRDPIVEVMLGQTNLNEDPECKGCAHAQKFRIGKDAVITHEDWNPNKVFTNGNDIILIRLPELAMTNREDEKYRVVPVCLAYNNDIELPTGKSIIAGWGRNEKIRLIGSGDFESSGAYTPNLLKAEVPVLNGKQCKEDYPVFKSISSEKHLCVGGTGKDTCEGDSGGPLLSYEGINDFADLKFLRGIVSFGSKKCGNGFPGVFTNVDYYMEWILSHLEA